MHGVSFAGWNRTRSYLGRLHRMMSATRAPGICVSLALISVVGVVSAQVVRDGSLGSGPETFTGAAIEITPLHGRQVGSNLFHSFSRFDLASGQTATFTGPSSVTNVLSRVTGGSPS